MKHILLREGIIWQALRQKKSSEFDVLWEILQSSKVQGYITAEDLEVLYRRIACDQDASVAAKLIDKFCRVLEIYPETGDCCLDAAIAEEGLAEVSIALYDTPLLSVSGFLKRYAIYELYATNRQTFQNEGWYRKWRAAGLDPLLIIPIALTLMIQNLPGFKELLANLSETSPWGFNRCNPMEGDRTLTADIASFSHDASTRQPLAKTSSFLNFNDSVVVNPLTSDRHLLIVLRTLDSAFGGTVLGALPKLFDLGNSTTQSPFNLLVRDSRKIKSIARIAHPNPKVDGVLILYSQAQIPARSIAEPTVIAMQSSSDIVPKNVNAETEPLKTSINSDGQPDADTPMPNDPIPISALADRPVADGQMPEHSITTPTPDAEVVAAVPMTEAPIAEAPMDAPALADGVDPDRQMPENILTVPALNAEVISDIPMSEVSITTPGSTQQVSEGQMLEIPIAITVLNDQELAPDGQMSEEPITVFAPDAGIADYTPMPEEPITTPTSDDQELALDGQMSEEPILAPAPDAGGVTVIPMLEDTTTSEQTDTSILEDTTTSEQSGNLSTDDQIPDENLTVSEAGRSSSLTREGADYLNMTAITNTTQDAMEQASLSDSLAGSTGVSVTGVFVNELSDLNFSKYLFVLEPTVAFTNIDLLIPTRHDLGWIIVEDVLVGEAFSVRTFTTHGLVEIHLQTQATDHSSHQYMDIPFHNFNVLGS